MIQECNLRSQLGAWTPSHCTDVFCGDSDSCEKLEFEKIYMYTNSTFTSTFTTNITKPQDLNPFTFGTLGYVDTDGYLPGGTPTPLREDPKIVRPQHRGIAWILGCGSTVYDLTYSWVDGSIREPALQTSNGTTARIFAAPLGHKFADTTLANAAILASLNDNSQDLARTWSTIFSQAGIALSAGVMSPHQNLLEQPRTSRLVARVPKAPLFTLVGLNLSYAVVGIILAFVAMSSKPRHTREVQARLSLAGLAAACFESRERNEIAAKKMEDLFEERDGGSERVGVVQTEQGGWGYVPGSEL